MTTNPKDAIDVVRYPDAWVGHVLDRPEPDLEDSAVTPKYTDFYNRYGMLDDRATRRLMALSDAERRVIIDEHHRRCTAVAAAWAERGEAIDGHDPRFDDALAHEEHRDADGQ